MFDGSRSIASGVVIAEKVACKPPEATRRKVDSIATFEHNPGGKRS